jgi:hypothetical protein
MPFESTVEAFARALADPLRPPPSGTRGRGVIPDSRRFAIYRNNVAVALIAALESRYPVTRRLVGDDFFRAMAGAFVARNKPRSAVIILYGADFPDFIAEFEPARGIVYLADVARLESAWVEAYHSSDEEALTLAALAGVDPVRLGDVRLTFHPAARLLRSDHPAASIWAAHQGEGNVSAVEHWRAEDALITRPGSEVLVRIVPAGGYVFAQALRSGATLGEAHSAADFEGFDPGSHLIGLIEAGAISHLQL